MEKLFLETTTGTQSAQWSAHVQFAEVQEPIDIERDVEIDSIVLDEIGHLPNAAAWIWCSKRW